MDSVAAGAAKPLSGFAYSDVNRLSQIKTQGEAGIRAAAQQFESLFIDMVMTSMRQASSAFGNNDYTSSDATKMHQEMLDHQWAVHIAENGGVGLADVIVRQLSGALAPKPRSEQMLPMPIAPATDVPATEPPPTAMQTDMVAPEWALSMPLERIATTLATAFGAEPPPGAVVGSLVSEDSATSLVDTVRLAVTRMGTKDGAFDGPVDFVAKVLPVLKDALAHTGLNPLAVLAQGALETGWGTHVIHSAAGASSHNLFNIKASADWEGPAVEVSTIEFRGGRPVQQRDRFRAYDSVEAAVRDYLAFLKGNARYERVLDAQDPEKFADELQKSGYATDPDYAAKILRVLTSGPLSAALAKFRG